MNLLHVLVQLLALLGRLFFRALSFCARAGVIAGSVAGFCFGLMQLAAQGRPISVADLIVISLVLTLAGWITVLLIVGVWLHYGVSAIFWPAFVNALLTSFGAVFLNNLLSLPVIAAPIGILVGMGVGLALCYFCRMETSRKEGVRHE